MKITDRPLLSPSQETILSPTSAQVAELADALGSGPSSFIGVQVRFLSWALLSNSKPNQKLRYLLVVSSAAHRRLNSSVVLPNN